MTETPRLLLIDDDPVVRRTLAEILEAAGHTVTPSACMAEGFDLVVAPPETETGPVPLVPVAKPVRASALLAAVAAALARHDPPCARFGIWRLDCGGRQLEDGQGRRLRLTDKETAILSLLARSGGVVPRQTLLSDVWGYGAAVTTHTLETHIYRLRRKIEPDPDHPALLLTETGGYRLALTEKC